MSTLSQLPSRVQRIVQQIYDVSVHQVSEYLITDQKLATLLDTSKDRRQVSEKLLVSENDQGLDLALFLDEIVLKRLLAEDPLKKLHDQNLEDFCLVVEGISHFVYLAFNAHHDRPVTQLEMELQAEVDKFITIWCLLQRQGLSDLGIELHRTLFDDVAFAANLDRDQRVRYRHANRFAGQYCHALQQRFLRRRLQKKGLFAELRRFYRLPQSQKLRHIGIAFQAA